LILTNERKKMSKKTLSKRISFVSLTALVSGLISIVPVSSANAVAITAVVSDTLYISTTQSISGIPSTSTTTQGMSSSVTSVGWLADSNATANSTDGGTFVNGSSIRTAVVAPGAKIGFTAVGSSTTGDGLTVIVTGGILSSLVATSSALGSGTGEVVLASTNINTAYTTVTTDAAGRDVISGIFNVSAAAGAKATIAIYSGSSIAGLTTATAGTLQGMYTLTVATTSASGVYSAADSSIAQNACLAIAGTSSNSGSNIYDTTSRCANGAAGVIYINLKDAYGAALTGSTITASATNSSLITSSTAAAAGSTANGATASYITLTASDAEQWIFAKQPVASTAGTSTISISVDGVAVATKVINWAGQVASLTVNEAVSNAVFSTSQADNTANIGSVAMGGSGIVYIPKDAAGNTVTLTSHPTVYAATGALVGATLSATTVTGYGAYSNSSTGYGYSMLVVPGNSLSGAGTYQLALTDDSGAYVLSPVIKTTVSRGSTNSFVASWDKAAYKFGDIATLTITVKDLYGNLMADGTALTGLTAGLIVSTAGFTAMGTACSDSSVVAAGVKTCKYAALNTEGTYSYSVDLNTVTAQSATLGSVPVAPSTVGVSNADVLKSIVALIASINKQIQALQKLILKR
jgi:hypothetical protein